MYANIIKMTLIRVYWYKFLFILIFLSLPLSVFDAAASDDCLGCHDGMKNMAHGSVTCQGCHKDASSFPHKDKLVKPSCNDCHQTIAKSHSKSIHGIKKVECKACHNAHAANKGTKKCTDCHAKADHKSLPSKEKHLKSLSCTSCHGIAGTSMAKVNIQTKGRGAIKRENIDLDKDNKIDVSEWDNLQEILRKNLNGKYSVTREYTANGDAHGITKKPQNCKTCHTDRHLFRQAKLQYVGAVNFDMPIDPSILIPEIPSISSYKKTVHGRKGIQCANCHGSRERINDTICIQCHRDVYDVYKHTIHSNKGATQCTHCHNPHRIEAYKEHSSEERLAICSRCHKDYVQKHSWLPNTTQHFRHLECSTCHSPESTKSMVFFLSSSKENRDDILNYETVEKLYGKNVWVTPLLDKNSDEIIDSRELSDFFTDVRKKLSGNAFIRSSIIVTKVHHDYSVKRQKERICATCHSDKAPFYESMYFILPENGYHMYVPVKGTILSATPVSVFIDISLLGEQKATWSDVKGFFFLKQGEFAHYARELGFKWIDIIGVGFCYIILFFILAHIAVRIFIKK